MANPILKKKAETGQAIMSGLGSDKTHHEALEGIPQYSISSFWMYSISYVCLVFEMGN